MPTSGPKKHVGKIRGTDQRCVVVYMQIPGAEDYALVVATDALPPRYQQAVIDLVESPEGQGETVLANLLHRRMLPDTGEKVLSALHNMGQLQKIHVDNVVMLPLPNQQVPLRQVIELIGGLVPNDRQTAVPENDALNKVNPYGQIQNIEATENNRGVAQNLLVEAQILEEEATKKREQAYRYAPDLRPQVTSVEKTMEVKPKKARATRSKKASA